MVPVGNTTDNKTECTDKVLSEIIEYDIIPTISEYWFDNESKVMNGKKIAWCYWLTKDKTILIKISIICLPMLSRTS